jgi:hypothetical protein
MKMLQVEGCQLHVEFTLNSQLSTCNLQLFLHRR